MSDAKKQAQARYRYRKNFNKVIVKAFESILNAPEGISFDEVLRFMIHGQACFGRVDEEWLRTQLAYPIGYRGNDRMFKKEHDDDRD